MTILDKYKWVARAWRYRLIIEKHEIRFLIKHLKPGQIAVDIGSHKGAYAFWMYKSLGNNGSVYAFEPQPQLYTTLKEIIDENEYNNIFVLILLAGVNANPYSLSLFLVCKKEYDCSICKLCKKNGL